MHDDTFERREFLKRLGLAGAGIFLGSAAGAFAAEATGSDARVPRRKFGRHDFTVSSLALGGHTLRLADDAEAARIVDAALAAGVDFFDNCWDYHDGKSEELMGKLMVGRRDRIFLMTKVCVHDDGDAKTAMRMLEDSLRRLRTDHIDLWQWHALSSVRQVERGFGPGGVLEAMEAARKQGKVRFLGFTGHTDPDVHLAVLVHKYPFDSCQMPLSAIEANSDAFVRRVLPVVLEQRIAPLAMKTMGGNFQPVRDGVLTPAEALGYALSLPVATVVSGMSAAKQVRENAAIATAFRPMTPAQMVALEQRVRPATDARKYEPYRHWMSYRDGDAARIATLA